MSLVMVDCRPAIVPWLRYCLELQKDFQRFAYTQDGRRMSSVKACPAHGTIYCDCSAFATYIYSWSGARDPNGLNFDGEGFTGTQLTHDKHVLEFIKNGQGVRVNELLSGDLVVYGKYPGEHVAVILDPDLINGDPMTVSMGRMGDPNTVRVSRGNPLPGSPVTFLRCDTMGPQIHFPPGYVPHTKPVVAPVAPAIPETPKIVVVAPPAAPVAKPAPAGYKTLAFGSFGANVKALQVHFGIKPATGLYGFRLLGAVKNYKLKNNIPPINGLVDGALFSRITSA